MLESILRQLADPAQPFSLFVRFVLKPGSNAEFLPAAHAVAAATRAEAGCIAYEFHRIAAPAETYLLCEKWQSFEALTAHFQTPHLAAFLALQERHAAAPVQLEVGQLI